MMIQILSSRSEFAQEDSDCILLLRRHRQVPLEYLEHRLGQRPLFRLGRQDSLKMCDK